VTPPAIRRRALALALPGLTLAGRRAGATAGAVTLVAGVRAGTAPDRWARSFAPFLERHWPHTRVRVLNLPGEGGLAAARLVALAGPGSGLIASVATPLLLARAVAAGADGLLDRLAFVAAVAEEPIMLVGHPGTVADLAAVRQLGPQATLGAPPPGSAPHLAGLAFSLALPLEVLAFPSAMAARKAVAAGNIPCAMLAMPEVMGAVHAGSIAALGIAQEHRSPLLPEVPTLAEQGIPLVARGHRGFAVPAGEPADGVALLTQALRAAVADPEFTDRADAQGYVPAFLGPAAWAGMLRRSRTELAERWEAAPWADAEMSFPGK
jgi:tripartite-type tricarboxylate transporter receptor subunit TctC